MGIGIRIFPGIRISASSRGIGIGASLGPLSASSSLNPLGGMLGSLGAMAELAGGGGSARGHSRTSLAAYERALRKAEKEEAYEKARRLLNEMLTMHERTFPEARPPVAPTPKRVDEEALVRSTTEKRLQDVPRLALSKRREAKALAAQEAAREADRLRALYTEEAAAAKRELDDIWRRLSAGDPTTVIKVVEQAFEDNLVSATPIDCDGKQLTIAMLVKADAYLPEKKPTRTEADNPSLRRWTLKDRNLHYAAVICSSALATIKEALAVAPPVDRVKLLVLRRHPPKPGRARGGSLEAIFHGVIRRSALADVTDWSEVEPAGELAAGEDVLVALDTNKNFLPLNLRSEAELAGVVRTTAESLGLEPVGAPEPLLGVPVQTEASRSTLVSVPPEVNEEKLIEEVTAYVDSVLLTNTGDTAENVAARWDIEDALEQINVGGAEVLAFVRSRQRATGIEESETPPKRAAQAQPYASKMSGAEIVRTHLAGSGPTSVGRRGGLHGDDLQEDVRSGAWRTRTYEVSFDTPKEGRNWFSTEEFVESVQG